MWPLSRDWYGDRLHPDYVPKDVESLQSLLTRAGLTAGFWQLA